MQALKERILSDGRNLGRGILKIDSFLNHQIDSQLMEEIGNHLASLFAASQPTRVLTAEVSGLIPAAMVGKALGNLPVVYARKRKPITMTEPVYLELAPSHTKGGEVSLMVSPEFLHASDRVLIIDDFLASGRTIDALARIVKASKGELIGIGVVVEKSFEGGRDLLNYWGVPIHSAATVIDMSEGQIRLAE